MPLKNRRATNIYEHFIFSLGGLSNFLKKNDLQ